MIIDVIINYDLNALKKLEIFKIMHNKIIFLSIRYLENILII